MPDFPIRMNFSDHFPTTHRYHRLTGSAAGILEHLETASPLYLHARNWMAEMAAIHPLMGSVVDDENQMILFPEQGLHLSLSAIQHLHTVAIEHRSRASLALEIATPGEPRAISIAAIPLISDLPQFMDMLASHSTEKLTEETYGHWRALHLIRPDICPCCTEAASERREKPEANPLARILCSVMDHGLTLHCRLHSPAFSFTQSLIPGNLFFSGGHITVTSRDDCKMLEIDPGYCHSFTLHRHLADAERLTRLSVCNSMGVRELTLETHGWAIHDEWLQLFREG